MPKIEPAANPYVYLGFLFMSTGLFRGGPFIFVR